MKNNKQYDFSGYATRYGIKCSDGNILGHGAFDEQDGATVPLVWMHNHKDMDNVIGHALLEKRNDGMYAYCSLNNSAMGENARELVSHGDVNSLSIYANKLTKSTNNTVTHGCIRELSLVLAGANPGAYIDYVMHGDNEFDETNFEAILFNDQDAEFVMQTDEENNKVEGKPDEETIQDVFNTMSDKQKYIALYWISETIKDAGSQITQDGMDAINTLMEQVNEEDIKFDDNETIQDVIDTFTDKQREAVEILIGMSLPDDVEVDEDNTAKHAENLEDEETEEMKKNVFDENQNEIEETLTHDEFASLMKDGNARGSLAAAINFADEDMKAKIQHSISNIDVLFPDFKAVGEPATIKEDNSYVADVMNSVHKSPFARIKSTAFNVTGDEARARGYVKGNKKVDEVISALKRTTDPQTVYKKQSLDRDDIVDITDFNVVAYLKNEMKWKLEEEIARAILIGDGRPASSEDKISTSHIRPILGDDTTYVTAKVSDASTNADEVKAAQENAKAFIRAVRKARKDYKGTGKPTLYVESALLDDLLLIEDKNERFVYETEEQLAKALRVSKIVEVEVFGEQTRKSEDGNTTYALQGILVNLTDYSLGADKQGQTTMFEDFDIDFNKQKYLIETRVSGALTKPYAAITFELKSTTATE